MHEIFREGVEWPWDDLIKFWVNSGKRVGGSKVKFFVITGHSSESVAFARRRGLLCPAPQFVLLFIFPTSYFNQTYRHQTQIRADTHHMIAIVIYERWKSHVSELLICQFEFICCRLQLTSREFNVAVEQSDPLIQHVNLFRLLHTHTHTHTWLTDSPNKRICVTRNVLDCDQSNYSSCIIFSHTFTCNQIRIRSENRFGDMAIKNYTRRLTAAILDLVQPEVVPFYPPTPTTLT